MTLLSASRQVEGLSNDPTLLPSTGEVLRPFVPFRVDSVFTIQDGVVSDTYRSAPGLTAAVLLPGKGSRPPMSPVVRF